MFSSFEVLIPNCVQPDLANKSASGLVLFSCVCLQATWVLREFAEFLSHLAISADKVIIVGDFNIHVDKNGDPLGTAFASIIDSIGFVQNVCEPTHYRGHTLDLVLSHGISVVNLTIAPHNPILSDHFLITFNIKASNPPVSEPRHYYSRSVNPEVIPKFLNMLPESFLSTEEKADENADEAASGPID
uniref:Endonuclease/exonuclease/phosphatase domain-containing protein n=1 Tax=Anguilla anguilla TaxID=7936 RepID=A0A0E9XE05_ANGAN